jgi:hypothetical protein
MGDNMNFSNDILLILLLSILSTPTDENGDVDFANNTNFLLLLLLVLQSSRAVENLGTCLCNNGINCCGNNSCNNNGCSACSGCSRLGF